MSTTNQHQRRLQFDGPREARRLERVERLLGRLGQPPEKITTAAHMFNYERATAIAKADSERVARLASGATKHPKAAKGTE